MTDTQKFAQLLKAEGIKYFTAREVFFLGDSNGRLKLNSTPPERLWHHIIPTLRFLDAVRERVGPLRLSSIYRNERYNKAVGGALHSQHKRFTACDVVPLRASVQQLWDACIDERRRQNFLGGLGRYRSFVHVDCRGSKATW
jgi:uncharacterized protein YcbK (DUF882 family)